MIDSIDIYKSFSFNIGIVMRNPEILKFVSDHLITKNMCSHAIEKLPFVLRYAPD